MSETYLSPFGSIVLSPGPEKEKKTEGHSPVQAWDTADDYLLTKLSEQNLPLGILIINDTWGGITCPVLNKTAGKEKIYCGTDSLTAKRTIEENCKRNRLTSPFYLDLAEKLPEKVDIVLIKVPGSLAYFEFILEKISRELPGGIPVIACGISRSMPMSFFTAFSQAVAGAEYSLIRKKARLYLGETSGKPIENPKPHTEYEVPVYNLRMVNIPGVFSYGKIDPGTRFLLDKMPRYGNPKRIADPGCGDGVLGLAAAKRWKDARIFLTDESRMAVESARLSAKTNGLAERVEIIQTDLMSGIDEISIDLILCNPPFHHHKTISMDLPFSFINDCRRVLTPGGLLYLVANRHLGYKRKLDELFAKVEIKAQNKKFIIYKCRK